MALIYKYTFTYSDLFLYSEAKESIYLLNIHLFLSIFSVQDPKYTFWGTIILQSKIKKWNA